MTYWRHGICDARISRRIQERLAGVVLNSDDGHEIVLDKNLNIRCATHDSTKLGWFMPHQGRAVWTLDRCPVENPRADYAQNTDDTAQERTA